MLSQSKTAVSSLPSPASIPEPKSSKPCSSPHPSAVSLSSHLHNDRHCPFHKSLPCKTQSLFPSYFNQKIKNETQQNTQTPTELFFFFTVTWTHSSFQCCCVTAEFLLLGFPLPAHRRARNPSPKPLLRATRTTPRSRPFHSLCTWISILPSSHLLG